jgi:hypothetical protein
LPVAGTRGNPNGGNDFAGNAGKKLPLAQGAAIVKEARRLPCDAVRRRKPAEVEKCLL